MSTKDQVYKLEKELRFWQRVHEHEPMDEREFKLERQIAKLENRDEFGIARYDGHIDNEDDDDDDWRSYGPSFRNCRYCGCKNLWWKQIDSKWRLVNEMGIHSCNEYKNRNLVVMNTQPQHHGKHERASD
jgi:hypothetical protein